MLRATRKIPNREPGPKVEKMIMLNSPKVEIYPAHNCLNANNCVHLNIY